MGLFDSLVGGVLGALTSGKPLDLGALGQSLNTALAENGGLQGLLDQLKSSGLGDQVSSWLGTGANLPVNADQIRAALGNEQLQQLAAQFGVPLDKVAGLLADHLPATVDQLSPNGKLEA